MALIETINASDLYHMACRMGRGDNFGYAGWNAIGDYLEQLSDDLGEDLEVDIVGICCEYSQADGIDDVWEQVVKFGDIDDDEWEEMDDEEKLEAVQDYLQENTTVVVCEENLIIWQVF